MLIEKSFKAIALELDGLDAYLYLRAYTSGLQEFVEALTFCSYLKTGNIQKFEEINKMFQYNIEETPDEENTTTSKTISLLFPYTEFILGLADFTGELMRKCINNLGDGNIDDCFKICNYVKYILVGFLGNFRFFFNPKNFIPLFLIRRRKYSGLQRNRSQIIRTQAKLGKNGNCLLQH